MEPWISVAQKQGFRLLIESHSTRSEAASDNLDGPTLAAMFRAEARAAEMINTNPASMTLAVRTGTVAAANVMEHRDASLGTHLHQVGCRNGRRESLHPEVAGVNF